VLEPKLTLDSIPSSRFCTISPMQRIPPILRCRKTKLIPGLGASCVPMKYLAGFSGMGDEDICQCEDGVFITSGALVH